MRYHNITKDDMLNGEGLRVVLWVAGCSHNCPECHNPVTWDIRGGIPFDQAAKDELFEELQKDYVSGVTLSGGDPLHPDNREETGRLIDEICDRFPGKTIWLYTGYDWEEICGLPCIRKVDVVVDGEFVAGQQPPVEGQFQPAGYRCAEVPSDRRGGDPRPELRQPPWSGRFESYRKG